MPGKKVVTQWIEKGRKPSKAFVGLKDLAGSALLNEHNVRPYKVRTAVGDFYAIAAGRGQAIHAVARMLARDATADQLTTRDLLAAFLPPDLGDKLPAE